MLQKLTFLVTILAFFAIGCSENTEKTTDNAAAKSDNMAQFTKDEKFKEAHDEPKKIDFQGIGKMMTFPTEGGADGSAYMIKNEQPTTKYLFVIHEWYGLNDHIKREAERLFKELGDVHVMALDIYDGNVADNREDAAKYMGMVKDDRAKAIINGAIAQAGEGATFGTIGWCFGGGWSLKSSILAGEQGKACVIYYGLPVKTAAELAPLKAPVLGIFAKNEQWINPDVVKAFEALAAATKKDLTVHSFDADHAFANPSSEKYVEEAATEANALALKFLQKNL
jgi:carboxymethylenebutenolidase